VSRCCSPLFFPVCLCLCVCLCLLCLSKLLDLDDFARMDGAVMSQSVPSPRPSVGKPLQHLASTLSSQRHQLSQLVRLRVRVSYVSLVPKYQLLHVQTDKRCWICRRLGVHLPTKRRQHPHLWSKFFCLKKGVGFERIITVSYLSVDLCFLKTVFCCAAVQGYPRSLF